MKKNISLHLIQLGRIDDAKYKCVALKDIASFLYQAGEKGKAINVFTHALETADSIDNLLGEKSQALSAIASSLAKSGEFTIALDTAVRIDFIKIKSETLNAIALFLAHTKEIVGKDKLYAHALEITDVIDNGQEKIVTLATLASSLGQAGMKKESKNVFNRAFDVAKLIDNAYGEKSQALSAIASSLAQAGEFNEAFKIINEIDYDDRIGISGITSYKSSGSF